MILKGNSIVTAIICLVTFSHSFGQETSGDAEINIDSVHITFLNLVDSLKTPLKDIITVNEGRSVVLKVNSTTNTFLLDVKKYYRIGFFYLMEDYGGYENSDAAYMLYGMKDQSLNKPIYYDELKQIQKLGQKMVKAKRMHRMLKLRDKLLLSIDRFREISAPS